MNDHGPFDEHDPHLSERMDRAVGSLRAPDVISSAIARGRRQRTHRRLVQGAVGVGAATALVLSVPAFAGDWAGSGQDSAAPPVASSPSATSSATRAPSVDPSADDECGDAVTGWWSKPSEQIRADLSALLPDGIRIGQTNDDWSGTWGGNLVTGDDADFASLTLVPPPGTPSAKLTLEQLAAGDRCAAEGAGPMQAVQPCDELPGHQACEEIRSEDDVLVGVVTESTEQTIEDGQEVPTDRTYFLATVAVPGGGHVELYVAEGTRADRPNTVHDPADVPALTMDQVHEIVTDPVWTS